VREKEWTTEVIAEEFQRINGPITPMDAWRKELADTVAWIVPLLPHTTIEPIYAGSAEHYVVLHAAAVKQQVKDFIIIRLRVYGDVGYLEALIKRQSPISTLYAETWFAKTKPQKDVVSIDKLRSVFAEVLCQNWRNELRYHVFLSAGCNS